MLNTDQIKRYVNGGGASCPFCESVQFTGDSIETGGGKAFQEVSCNECNASWLDEYRLSGVMVVTGPSTKVAWDVVVYWRGEDFVLHHLETVRVEAFMREEAAKEGVGKVWPGELDAPSFVEAFRRDEAVEENESEDKS